MRREESKDKGRRDRSGQGSEGAKPFAGRSAAPARTERDERSRRRVKPDGPKKEHMQELQGGGDEEREFIGGKHSVMEAFQAGRSIHKLWIADTAQPHWSQPIYNLAKEAGIIIQTVDKRKLDQLAPGLQHQGVVAQVASASYVELDELIERVRRSDRPALLVLLDELEDPHNLGSILRSAEGAGAHGVIIPKRRSVGLTMTVSKTSAGAIEYMPVARVTNLAQAMDALKEEGIWIVGAAGESEQTVYDIDFKGPMAIVIGNEHKGMGRLVREKCDFVAKLPMLGKIQSLNASVAAGLFLYEAVRQRQEG